ncbi:DgyrCDS6190 [Dimorphilus gyrociliatus]|uniref:Pyridine nucleotide-disulfide oxidoreductase domain-containing protein 1 n=1 Tax=Dimorphilus gyrociliatus TaxID=2664684 RepID=A0A7I8VN46_9ANNE|nr:DgyrCDS6190 [Dimorphilus gyrociliatus]
MSKEHYKFVVIGGGIAGVTCVETLETSNDDRILLLTASPLVKVIQNFKQISKVIEEFDVTEKKALELEQTCKNVTVHQEVVDNIDFDNKIISTKRKKFKYEYLCICTGGKPKLIAENNPYVIGIRDVETVQIFQKKLKSARKVLIVGNGGIATELAYELKGCDVIWAIKDSSITSTFVDAGAAQFFLPTLLNENQRQNKDEEGATICKRLKYGLEGTRDANDSNIFGGALGPDWASGLELIDKQDKKHVVQIEYSVEIDNIIENTDDESEFNIKVRLTNGKEYKVDFIVSATGVEPNTSLFSTTDAVKYASDGGVKVTDKLETGVKDVFAAGDVIYPDWKFSDQWIHMRLWTQARQTGHYAAKCMLAKSQDDFESISLDFCFECFAHSTRFFGYKVILLGKFNGQGLLKSEYEALIRLTKGEEYVKVILKDGRMQGAILVGETDLEEMCENLILNGTDLSSLGDDLLNPNIDIEDYFD